MTKTVIDQALSRKTISESAMDQIATVVAQVRAQIEGQGAQEKYRARLECVRMASDIIQENNRNQIADGSGGPVITPEDLIAFADQLAQYINGGE